jgi:RraA family protein
MANIGCRIYPDFQRPDKKLMEGFKGMPVANIDDNMNRTAAVDPSIKPFSRDKAQLVGSAFTIKVPEGDNLMFHKGMDMAQPGDVIVIDAGGSISRSIFGEIMVSWCKIRGIAGIVVDGSIRDCDEIAEMKDFPVYAKGVTPNGPYKNGPGEIRGTVCIGGQVVNPGDIIVGDQDGIVIIKPEEAAEILEKTQAVFEKEGKIISDMREKGTYDRPWVDDKLKEIGCEIL